MERERERERERGDRPPGHFVMKDSPDSPLIPSSSASPALSLS